MKESGKAVIAVYKNEKRVADVKPHRKRKWQNFKMKNSHT